MNVTIVGTGPSLLKLTAADLGDDPVIVLNSAILEVRKLGLPNVVYTMQKDCCIAEPIEPERLLVSADESAHCFPDYPFRHVFDVVGEFAIASNTMSAPVAVRLAVQLGATSIRMLAFDGHSGRDSRRVMPDGRLKRMPRHRYVVGGRQSVHEARRFGVAISFG